MTPAGRSARWFGDAHLRNKLSSFKLQQDKGATPPAADWTSSTFSLGSHWSLLLIFELLKKNMQLTSD